MTGKGVVAKVADRSVLVGNRRLLEDNGVDTTLLEPLVDRLSGEGKTPMMVAVDAAPAGVIAVADTLKPESAAAVAALQRAGIDVVMMTGDNRRTAEAIGRAVGIDTVLAEVLPGDKASEITRLQGTGRKVGMVGDGINDAPALAQADVGIAIGTGTDVAIEAADITLMSGGLDGVVTAMALSRATMRNIRQNLGFAFGYNAAGIPLAAGLLYPFTGWLLSPIIAAAAMAASSLSVVGNASRLRRFTPPVDRHPGASRTGTDTDAATVDLSTATDDADAASSWLRGGGRGVPVMARTVPLARRNLLAEPRRLAASAAGVGMALMLILLLDGLWAGIEANVTTYEDNVGADLFIAQPGTRNFFGAVSSIPADTVSTALSRPGCRVGRGRSRLLLDRRASWPQGPHLCDRLHPGRTRRSVGHPGRTGPRRR